MAEENETPEVEETTPAPEASTTDKGSDPVADESTSTADAGSDPVAAEATEPVADEGSDPSGDPEPDPSGDPDPEPAGDPEPVEAGPTLTRKEQRAAVRHVEASKRKPRTVEERVAARLEERKQKAAQRKRRREKAKAARATGEKGPAKTASTAEHGPGRPKTRQGLVVSSKADKTISVRVDTARRHRRYEKIVRSSSTLHAHDESNDANEGDLVTIIESRPLSKLKRWRLVEVLERAK
jgi:small subunit ribosomal protein S17